MRVTLRARSAALCVLLGAPLVDAATLTGRVVGVTDGDTLSVADAANVHHAVRLAAIDAPEAGQPHATESELSLSRLVLDRDVRVEWHAINESGGLIGTLWVVSPDMLCRGRDDCPKTLDAGLAQLTVGLAWHPADEGRDLDPQRHGQYEFAQMEPRARRLGLWRDPSPVPPWEWRRFESTSGE